MARKSAPRVARSTADQVTALFQRHTIKEIAALLGKNRRTIQRWKNTDVTPLPTNAKMLAKEASKERSRIRAQARRAGVAEPGAVPLPAKRQTRRDPNNTNRRIKSDTVIFDASHARLSDIAAMLAPYRGKNIAFRVIYKLPAGRTDYQMMKYREPRMVSTAWESILQKRFRTDEGIESFLQEVREIGPIHYAVITLPKSRGRKAAKK